MTQHTKDRGGEVSNLKRDIEMVLMKGGISKGIHRIVYDESGEDPLLGHNKLSPEDTLTETTTQIINLIESVLPEEIDVKSKYETGEDGGINVTVDENNDTLTGENLVHLARLASDEGWNKAIKDIKSKLIGKE